MKLNSCAQLILNQLQGMQKGTPYQIKLAKKMAKNPLIQHYMQRLCAEIQTEATLMNAKSRRGIRLKNQVKPIQWQQKPALELKFRAPNVMTGQAFSVKVKPLESLPLGRLELCHLETDLNVMLTVERSTLILKGLIKEDGHCHLYFTCFLLLPSGEKQQIKGQLKISAIPDPRSLWKDIPSDSMARFHKPDSDSKACITDKAKLIAASVRGRSHAHKGIHRDDDIQLHCSEYSDWHVLCVADGAGSCEYSRRGAELAVKHATETLQETLNSHYGSELEKQHAAFLLEASDEIQQKLLAQFRYTIVKAVFEAAKAIEEEAKTAKKKFKDFSTTLLLAAYKPVEDGHLVLSFWIGDGGAVIYNKQQEVILLGEPDSGEYAGQTRFLDQKLFSDGSVYQRIKIKKVKEMTALILATDGITDAKFDTESQLGDIQYWDKLWAELELIVDDTNLEQAKTNLIQWMDFWSAGNHDDRSIALCLPKEEIK